jgi:hypothetical protein
LFAVLFATAAAGAGNILPGRSTIETAGLAPAV